MNLSSLGILRDFEIFLILSFSMSFIGRDNKRGLILLDMILILSFVDKILNQQAASINLLTYSYNNFKLHQFLNLRL